MKGRSWNAEDTRILCFAVSQFGPKWRDIKRMYFPFKSDDSVRNRWMTIEKKKSIEPKTKRKNVYKPWTSSEDNQIVLFVNHQNKKNINWNLAVPYFKYRNARAIRGRWDRLKLRASTTNYSIDENIEFQNFMTAGDSVAQEYSDQSYSL
jgi:hypothetical protein